METNNRYGSLQPNEEEEEGQEARATELYDVLAKQYDPANAKATDRLRQRLLQACKGLQVSDTMREAMLKLGYDQDTPLEQQIQ